MKDRQSANPRRIFLKFSKSGADALSSVPLLLSPSLQPRQKAANSFGPSTNENKIQKEYRK